MADQKRWVVTLSNERPLAEVRRELKAAGFSVDQAMEEIGVVTGRCAPDAATKVRKIKGVADVSADRDIDIGPPGSDTTW